jgi:hypothetical protein
LEFACAPSCCSPFCSAKPDLTHPNSSRFEPKHILGEDEKNLDEVVTLELQF